MNVGEIVAGGVGSLTKLISMLHKPPAETRLTVYRRLRVQVHMQITIGIKNNTPRIGECRPSANAASSKPLFETIAFMGTTVVIL